MVALYSFAALFLSIALVQVGTGALGPLDAIAGTARGFTTAQIGLLGSAHFVGFFIGCWAAPRLIARVGPARAFAFMAAIGTVATLAHPLVVDPYVWSLFRVGNGLTIAGVYTVVESLLNAELKNSNRGQVFGVYRFVDLLGSLIAQSFIIFLDPLGYAAYSLLAIFGILSLMPLALSKRKDPPQQLQPNLRPFVIFQMSPVAGFGVIVAGLTTASLRMVGPIFGTFLGLSIGQIAAFLFFAVLGGAVAQPFVGYIADKFDRRSVLIGLSACGILVSILFSLLSGLGDVTLIMVLIFLFGAITFPIYSVSAAYANDRAQASNVVGVNASLVFLYGVGAIVAPFLSASILDSFGPRGFLAFIALAHLALIVLSLSRISVRPTPATKTPYRYLPRTTYILTRMFKKSGTDQRPDL